MFDPGMLIKVRRFLEVSLNISKTDLEKDENVEDGSTTI
jgi:hypothetical protein